MYNTINIQSIFYMFSNNVATFQGPVNQVVCYILNEM